MFINIFSILLTHNAVFYKKACKGCQKHEKYTLFPRKSLQSGSATCNMDQESVDTVTVQKETIAEIQTQMQDSDVDHILHSYESLRTYKKRTRNESLVSTFSLSEEKPKRNHGPKHVDFDIEKAKNELEQHEEGTVVNWAEMAVKYGITNSNNGQILKEQLQKNGVDVGKYKNSLKRSFNEVYHRRENKKVKLANGKSFSVPKHRTAESVRAAIQEKIDREEIDIGRELNVRDCVGRVKDINKVRQNYLEEEITSGIKRMKEDELKLSAFLQMKKKQENTMNELGRRGSGRFGPMAQRYQMPTIIWCVCHGYTRRNIT